MLTPHETVRLAYLIHNVRKAEIEVLRLKEKAKKGSSNEVITVYSVKPTFIRSHHRRGFRAVRVRVK